MALDYNPDYLRLFDPTRLTIADIQPINWSWFKVPGTHVCIGGMTGSGKTSLLLLLARMLLGQEVVIARDTGSLEFLDFANRGYMVRAFVPKGCIFKPDPRTVDVSYIKVLEYDPKDLEGTLFPRFADDEAIRAVNLIEFDIFSRSDALVVEFWKRIIYELPPWKQRRCRKTPFALFLDEFTDISIQRRAGAKLYAEHDVASNLVTRAIRNYFRKNRIRLVAIANPIKALDDILRSQFAYFLFKEMAESDLPDWARMVSPLVRTCKMDEVVVLGGRPRRYARFALPPLARCRYCQFWTGTTCSLSPKKGEQRNATPNTVACRKFRAAKIPGANGEEGVVTVIWPTNNSIQASIEAPAYFGADIEEEASASKRERMVARRITKAILALNRRGVLCPNCGKDHKVPFSEIARIFGWRTPSVPLEWVKRHPLEEAEVPEGPPAPEPTPEETPEATTEEA